MIPSILRQKVDQKTTENIVNNPAATTGFVVRTGSVVDLDIRNNPYFAPMNHLAAGDIDRYNALGEDDSVKTGLSVIHKPPGSIRDFKTYINPKWVDGTLGSEDGKRQAYFPGAETTAEMMNVGSKTITPTVVASYSFGKGSTVPAYTGENYIPGDLRISTPEDKPESGLASDGTLINPPIADYRTGPKEGYPGYLPPPTTKLPNLENGKNSQGSNARTGSYLIPNPILDLVGAL